ncbi:hypothetical protein PR048_019861 [Dryococelus australis]|uniref:Uncharacterized protein n=1 Tax=Dryococelus australis TaxID=614101 RepID=A0ABQ9H4N4_9NEOP|nr:hypothetical protein PR048_019861 [Dryococelus australis]
MKSGASRPSPVFSTRYMACPNVGLLQRTTVAERLAYSSPTKANRFILRLGHSQIFAYENCGSIVSPALSFRHCYILTSITLIGSQDFAEVKSEDWSMTNTQAIRVGKLCSTDPESNVPHGHLQLLQHFLGAIIIIFVQCHCLYRTSGVIPLIVVPPISLTLHCTDTRSLQTSLSLVTLAVTRPFAGSSLHYLRTPGA